MLLFLQKSIILMIRKFWIKAQDKGRDKDRDRVKSKKNK
jgi:hypothetical protein